MMKSSLRFFSTITALTIALAACTSAPPRPQAASDLGSVSVNDSGVTTLRPYRERNLSNGLKVLFINENSLPSLSFGLLIQSGATADPEGQTGLSNLVSDLLSQGTKKRDASKIADDLGLIGATFSSNVDNDYTYLALNGLSFSADQLLANFSELAMEPSFPDQEIERTKKQTLAMIDRGLDNSRVVADRAANQFLFGTHPYGRPVSGSYKDVAALTKKNIIQHYLRYYRPNNAILTVVGKFDAEFEKKVEAQFGSWVKRDVPKLDLDAPKAPEGLRIRVVEKAGLTQAQIRFGAIGIRRKDDDFLDLRVANTILGGAFASRLSDRIRKDLGLTYSISSNFDARLELGAFEIETFTKIESIETLIAETLKMYKEFVSGGVKEEELKRARGYLRGIFPQAIETSEKLALNLVLLRLYGISDRYLTHYIRDLESLSVSDINSAIRRKMRLNDLSIVVHGPPGTAERLKSLTAAVDTVPVETLR